MGQVGRSAVRAFGVIGAVGGLLSVSLGAFAAHVLKSHLSADMLDVFQTGVHYLFFHAIAILAVALFMLFVPSPAALQIAAWSFTIGSVLFSGSLFALSTSGVKWIGAITPIGGVLFLGGWTSLAYALGTEMPAPGYAAVHTDAVSVQ